MHFYSCLYQIRSQNVLIITISKCRNNRAWHIYFVKAISQEGFEGNSSNCINVFFVSRMCWWVLEVQHHIGFDRHDLTNCEVIIWLDRRQQFSTFWNRLFSYKFSQTFADMKLATYVIQCSLSFLLKYQIRRLPVLIKLHSYFIGCTSIHVPVCPTKNGLIQESSDTSYVTIIH